MFLFKWSFTLLYDLEYFRTIFVHSYMIPEHSYTILNTIFEHFSVSKIITPSENSFQNMSA